MKIKDQLHRELIFETLPTRIVSLVPSQTELLVDMGHENQLLGITKFCVHPNYLKRHKVVIGGTKNVHYEKVQALQPDIIFCNKEENTEEMVIELKKIAPVYVSNISNIADVLQLISDVGVLFNKKIQASKITEELQKRIKDFKNFMRDKPAKKVAYFIWSKPWMVAGGDTFINSLLKCNKFDNIYKKYDRYPEIDVSELKELQLELILLSSEPYPFKEEQKVFLQKFTNANILFVDGEFFSWYGTRLLKAFDYFKTLHK